jgi:hypothetical protein
MLIQILSSCLIINQLNDFGRKAFSSGENLVDGGKSTAFQVQYSEWKGVIPDDPRWHFCWPGALRRSNPPPTLDNRYDPETPGKQP